MHRFFVGGAVDAVLERAEDVAASPPPGPPLAEGAVVSLSEADAAHAARVLRLSPGSPVVVCDGRGYEYEAELVTVEPRATTARIKRGRLSAAEPWLALTLAQGIAKGDKMDLVVQKAVEVGVSRVLPLATARTVVRLEEAKAAARVQRWQRIAYEAAKQSGRARIPAVAAVHSWSELWRRDDLGVVLVPWEGEPARRLLETARALLPARPAQGGPSIQLTVVIGPEGGLTEDEIALARENGAYPVSLGPRILRTETAGLVAASLVLAAAGDLG